MGTKNNPDRFDCHTKAHPDEPMFILLGRDPLAPTLVEWWAAIYERNGGNPAKIDEARACAMVMRQWESWPHDMPEDLARMARERASTVQVHEVKSASSGPSMLARYRACRNEFQAYLDLLANLEARGLYPHYDFTPKTHEQIIADVLGIDLKALEAERDAFLDEQQKDGGS